MDIGTIIYNRRKELKLTLEEVGNYVGVGKSTVKKWESGFIANIKRDKIAKLAEILQLNPVTFINGVVQTKMETNIPLPPTNSTQNYITFTPDTSPKTQTLLVFNKNGKEGAYEKIIPSDDVLNEINKLAQALKPYPAEQINALLKLVENGGNIPLKADMPADIKELVVMAANLSEENRKTLIQVAKSMK